LYKTLLAKTLAPRKLFQDSPLANNCIFQLHQDFQLLEKRVDDLQHRIERIIAIATAFMDIGF